MSIRIEHRIGVAASAEKVWDVIADLERWPEWNDLHVEVTGKIAIGGSLSLTEVLPGEPPRAAMVSVPDWTPEQQLVWRHKRGFLSHSVRYFEIDPLNNEGCILANGEIFDGMIGEDWAIKRRGKFQRAFQAINEKIKARAEAV